MRAAWRVGPVRAGTLGSTLVLAGSLTPAFLPPASPLNRLWLLRSLQDGPGRIVATAILLAGVLLLLGAWLRLYPRDHGVDVSRMTLVLWCAPLLLAPPLFSNDAYSYAAQGRIVDVGMDPYEVSPSQLDGPFAAQVDPAWLTTPAPYGPLALRIQDVMVDLAGERAYASAVAMRVPSVLAMVLLVVLLPRLARHFGKDPRFALWLGVLNPLTVLHLLGGAHNDALMIALVVVALWLATKRHLVLASLAVALAAAIKQPALVAVVAVGLLCVPVSGPDAEAGVGADADADAGAGRRGWLGARIGGAEAHIGGAAWLVSPARAVAQAWTRARLGAVAAASAIALAGFALVTAATGLGFGWIEAMGVPGQVRNYIAPSTSLGALAEAAFRVLALDTWVDDALPAARSLALVVCGLVVAWLVLAMAPRHPVTSLVLIFMTLVVCAPTVQPWYVLWGGVLLGVTALGRLSLRAATWLTAFFACYGVVVFAANNGIVALGVCGVLGVLWIVTGHDRELVRV